MLFTEQRANLSPRVWERGKETKCIPGTGSARGWAGPLSSWASDAAVRQLGGTCVRGALQAPAWAGVRSVCPPQSPSCAWSTWLSSGVNCILVPKRERERKEKERRKGGWVEGGKEGNSIHMEKNGVERNNSYPSGGYYSYICIQCYKNLTF